MSELPSRKDDAPDRSPPDDANVVVPPPRSRLPDHRVQQTQGPPELRRRVVVRLVKAVICWANEVPLTMSSGLCPIMCWTISASTNTRSEW